MCGIAGFIDFSHTSTQEELIRMVKTLHHRGPDDSGTEVFQCGKAQVGLGHARLSIIDLSPGGHQPMTRGRFSIVYNGEIYNYKEIREELRNSGYSFISESDTEVVLHAFDKWGEQCVERFVGMFAFVLVDQKDEKVYFFRDRAGVKPLYIYRKNGITLFASELKAFHQHNGFQKEINPSVLRTFFDYSYLSENQAIYSGVEKMLPGNYGQLDCKSGLFKTKVYWSAEDYYCQPKLEISYEEAKEQLHELLKSAFNYRMVSDVPVGVFLSGGYDSTAVAAILQKNNSARINTFTIGFEHGNNEAPFARETAKILGTAHHEYICTSREAQEIITDLPFYFDEPFADSSAIPTVLVSRFAKQYVNVALSADGGDEIFAGYSRYQKLHQFRQLLNKIPSISAPIVKGLSTPAGFLMGQEIGYQLEVLGTALQIKDPFNQSAFLYDKMHRMPKEILDALILSEKIDNKSPVYKHTMDVREMALLHDYLHYLPSDILTKVDRSTMSASLEGREPFLDHRILEFTARLPYEYKQKDGIGKRILKDIVHEYVPKEIMNRPKAGFSIPMTHWFKTDLKELLFDSVLSQRTFDFLNKSQVEKILNDFIANRLHYTPLIWKLLMFSMWVNKWEKNI